MLAPEKKMHTSERVHDVSWSCLLSFLCNPYIPFIIYEIFYLLVKVKAVMDQFKKGLDEAGVLQYMTKYFDIMTPLFVNEEIPLTASKKHTQT